MYSSKDVRQSRSRHHGCLARVEVELLALTDCVAGCAKLGYKKLHPLKLRVFVGDIRKIKKELKWQRR